MKNTDIALVILIAAVSIGLSYWLGNLILGDPSDDTYQISYVEGVSAEIMQPDIETFNPSGVNPTVEVIIGTCKDGEKYDEELRKCVEVDKKKDKSGGGDNPDNPEPDNPEPEPTPE
jgi:hypothetical protein